MNSIGFVLRCRKRERSSRAFENVYEGVLVRIVPGWNEDQCFRDDKCVFLGLAMKSGTRKENVLPTKASYCEEMYQ
jgi:hypothetical protein